MILNAFYISLLVCVYIYIYILYPFCCYQAIGVDSEAYHAQRHVKSNTHAQSNLEKWTACCNLFGFMSFHTKAGTTGEGLWGLGEVLLRRFGCLTFQTLLSFQIPSIGWKHSSQAAVLLQSFCKPYNPQIYKSLFRISYHLAALFRGYCQKPDGSFGAYHECEGWDPEKGMPVN